MRKLSLKLRFIIYFCIATFATWLVATGISYILSKQILREVFDSQQVLFAKRLASIDINKLHAKDKQLIDIKSKAIKRFEYDDDILSFAVFNLYGKKVFHDDEDGEDFVFNDTVLKQQDPVYMQDTKKWRIIWLRAKNNTIIAVGQEKEYRTEMAQKMAMAQALPWLIMLALLMIITIFMLSRELAPLNKLAKQLKQRRPEDDSLIQSNHAPQEIQPFIDALNSLFTKISEMIVRERRFTENAAHELRSPLAALRIQAEVAQIATISSAQQKTALSNLMLGIDRASRLIDQLLTLSRLDAENKQLEKEPIDWSVLINSEINLLTPLAHKKQINIHYQVIESNTTAIGVPLFISLLIRNLIDNALKYCPEGSTVTITEDKTSITIEDNGNGVDKETLTKLGERFYRPAGIDITGSGLGISIVKQVATLHHWQLTFYNISAGGLGIKIKTS